MDTHFAPANRTDRRKLKNQINTISHSPIMSTLLTTTAGLLVVLNEDRQIVALNSGFLAAIGVADPQEVLGLRLGESLRCVYAHDPPNGCGTTAHCVTCGAAIAMMAALDDSQVEEQICALKTEQDGVSNDICLLIRAHAISIEGEKWVLIYAQDITQQQFWINLERVFFHDINNALSSLVGYSELLAADQPDNQLVHQIRDAAVRMHREIALQRSLAKHKDLYSLLKQTQTPIARIRHELDLIIRGHRALSGKHLDEVWPTEDISIYTDPLLVSRVLGNMIINAMEATPEGATVKMITDVNETAIIWHVWNQGYIPQSMQKRIFQRHFSTKSDAGRGLGTFSMKLLGEKYLNGKITFISDEEVGTTFTFQLPLN